MNFALVQYAPVWENKEKNIKKLNSLLNDINFDFDAIIFPEMSLTGFTMNSSKYAETITEIGFTYFAGLAGKYKKDVFAGIIENVNGAFYNSLIHFNTKGYVEKTYRKIHLFSLAGEDKNYTEGNEIVIAQIGNTKIGLTICYDLRFPELYRFYAKEKVDLIINIANWPIKRIEHWNALLKARAIENQCFIIGVNRVGIDGKSNKYNGCSSVFNPLGDEIAFVENEEKIIKAEVDLSEVEKVRNKFKFISDIKMI